MSNHSAIPTHHVKDSHLQKRISVPKTIAETAAAAAAAGVKHSGQPGEKQHNTIKASHVGAITRGGGEEEEGYQEDKEELSWNQKCYTRLGIGIVMAVLSVVS